MSIHLGGNNVSIQFGEKIHFLTMSKLKSKVKKDGSRRSVNIII